MTILDVRETLEPAQAETQAALDALLTLLIEARASTAAWRVLCAAIRREREAAIEATMQYGSAIEARVDDALAHDVLAKTHRTAWLRSRPWGEVRLP